MTKQQYENRFMTELEDIWNESARYQYLNWESFIEAMYIARKESEYE